MSPQSGLPNFRQVRSAFELISGSATGAAYVQVNISARHGELSEATQNRIRDKVGKLPRYFDRLTAIDVTVDLKDKDSTMIELRVSAEHTPDFVAAETSESFSGALDQVVRKLEKQLRRHKDKLTGHRITAAKHIDAPVDEDDDDDE